MSQSAYQAIASEHSRVFVSSASAWEIATKYRIGKLPSVTALIDDLEGHLRRERFETLSVSIAHATMAG